MILPESLDSEIEQRDTEELTLFQLAEAVNEEHKAAEEAMREAVAHAIEAGRLLREAKDRVEHGEWQDWVRDKTRLSLSTARLYKRVAREVPELPKEERQRVVDLPLRQVDAYLRNGSGDGDEGPDESGGDDTNPLPVLEDSTLSKRERIRERFRALRKEHDALAGWTLSFNDTKRRAGRCRHLPRTIELAEWTLNAPLEEATDTLLHEVAHALTPGGERSHGEQWKKKAKELGATPERCYDEDMAAYRPTPTWYLVCAKCNTKLDDRWQRTDVSGKAHKGCEGSAGRLVYVDPGNWSPEYGIETGFASPTQGPSEEEEPDPGMRDTLAQQAAGRIDEILQTEEESRDPDTVAMLQQVFEERRHVSDRALHDLVRSLEKLSRRARSYANRLRLERELDEEVG